MKKIGTIAALLSLIALSQAQAAFEPAAPAWACKVSAQMKDKSFALIVGLINVTGKGTVRCTSALGQKVEKPVIIQMVGFSYGPDVHLPTGRRAQLDILSAAVGLSSVDAMFGDYSVSLGVTAQVGATQIGVKRDVLKLTPKIPNGGISTGFSVHVSQGGQFGLGINKNITGMAILTPEQFAQRKFQREQRWMNARN